MTDEYRRKIEDAIMGAIFEASRDQATQTIVLDSAEVVTACLNTIAFMTVRSKLAGSPTSVRKFCDDLAKRTRLRIAEVQRLSDAGEIDFLTVVDPERRH